MSKFEKGFFFLEIPLYFLLLLVALYYWYISIPVICLLGWGIYKLIRWIRKSQ